MKKSVFLIIISCLMSVVLMGCEFGFLSNAVTSEDSVSEDLSSAQNVNTPAKIDEDYFVGKSSIDTVNRDNDEPVTVFKTTCQVKSNPDYAENYISYRDDDYYYYIFELGTVYNAKLEEGATQPYIGGVKQVLEFTSSATSSEKLQRYTESVATKTTTTTWHADASINYTRNWGNVAKNPKRVLSVGLSAGWKGEWSDTNTQRDSLTETVERVNTQTAKQSFTFDKNSKPGQYCYILLGTVKIYEIVAYDVKNDKYNSAQATEILSANRVLVYLGDDVAYDDEEARNTLTFDESMIKMCSLRPEKYVESNYTPEYTTKSLTIFNSVIQRDEVKLNGSGVKMVREIKFGKTLSELKFEGYEKIKIYIEYEIAEADDCFQYISVYNSSNVLYETKFSHGGFTAYTKTATGIIVWENHKTASFSKYYIDKTYDIEEIFENTVNFKAQAENARFRDFYIKNVKATITAFKEVIKQ